MKHSYPQRGYIYWYVHANQEGSRSNPTPSIHKSSIQSLNRPWLIVSNNIGNRYSPTVIALPCTTSKQKKQIPTHVEITARGIRDIIMAEQIRTLDSKDLLLSPVVQLTDDDMENVNRAIKVALELMPQTEW